MKRYDFLKKDSVETALEKLRASFLATKNLGQVNSIINSILTMDEQIKIGRRIQIAELLKEDFSHREIADLLKVGMTTVMSVVNSMDRYPDAFKSIIEKDKKVKPQTPKKSVNLKGGSKLIFKRKY